AFTGSTSWITSKTITLELGGKSPNIIFSDADMLLAVEQAAFGLFFNQGQCCCAGSRTFVESKKKFMMNLLNVLKLILAEKRVLGNPFNLNVTQGPQIDEEQEQKEGAKLVTGGVKYAGKESDFGPVMSIIKFNDIKDLVEKANATNYGLAAGVVTKDLDKALYVANNIRAGTGKLL
ncbi:Aldedh domain-containing protein, partial [Meloidogyne graminicola]